MMITIAVADFNQTYCQGLKTMLEQVEGFEVVLLPLTEFRQEDLNKLPIDILLVDEDLYQCDETVAREGKMVYPVMKTIILTMDRFEMTSQPRSVEVICKGAGKREFTERIMKLTLVKPC
ncbi:MAG: hypothetical protein WCI71_07175 [Bacteroidota bacterium]